MYWTHELISFLENAPFPATKEDLIAYAERASSVPIEVLENLKELPDGDISYQSTDDLWPDRFEYDELNHLDDEDSYY